MGQSPTEEELFVLIHDVRPRAPTPQALHACAACQPAPLHAALPRAQRYTQSAAPCKAQRAHVTALWRGPCYRRWMRTTAARSTWRRCAAASGWGHHRLARALLSHICASSQLLRRCGRDRLAVIAPNCASHHPSPLHFPPVLQGHLEAQGRHCWARWRRGRHARRIRGAGRQREGGAGRGSRGNRASAAPRRSALLLPALLQGLRCLWVPHHAHGLRARGTPWPRPSHPHPGSQTRAARCRPTSCGRPSGCGAGARGIGLRTACEALPRARARPQVHAVTGQNVWALHHMRHTCGAPFVPMRSQPSPHSRWACARQAHTWPHTTPPPPPPPSRPSLPPAAPPQEFELTLDVDRLIREVDKDRSGFLDYHEFAAILR